MNLNQSNFYRRNPYHKEGYIPPMGHQNRHQPDFLTEIPMGQHHLDNAGRKHFRNQSTRSNIDSDHIFTISKNDSFQTQFAMDKSYLRSLNTLDIEGSAPGSIMSTAVKNKIKAQKELQRRKKQQQRYNLPFQANINNSNGLKESEFSNSEQEIRREIAIRQFKKNRELAELLSRKNYHNKDNNIASTALEKISSNYHLSAPRKEESESTEQMQSFKRLQALHNQKQRITNSNNQSQYLQQRLNGYSHLQDYRLNKNFALESHQLTSPTANQNTKRRQQYPHQMLKYDQQGRKYKQTFRDNPQSQKNKEEAQIRLKEQELFKLRRDLQAKYRPIPKMQTDLTTRVIKQPPYQGEDMSAPLQSSVYEGSRSFGSRNQLRKINPTYLSYGSPIISFAGKQALGY